ncbi:pilus assembly protein [Rhodopirellula sp. ICT_H3.1]|uniref:Pilus assembly protein n=2 Tax=Aporhodopirellula aestuarii TaxID=2950107 RepID=A0ABT0U9R9_9BACT|nr:pilus assembly protein [Aporhodopirellula aestuarii]
MFLFLFASIEFGRVQMAIGALEEAARSGCRVATLKNNTAADVKAAIAPIADGYGISKYSVEIKPTVLDSVPQWDPITVRVSASLADVSWLPIPEYFAKKKYTAACVFPREADLEL